MAAAVRISEPGSFVLYDGRLARVVAIGEGRTVHLEFLEEQPCGSCGRRPEMSLLEHSPLFQNGVRPVPTAEASTS